MKKITVTISDDVMHEIEDSSYQARVVAKQKISNQILDAIREGRSEVTID